MAKNRVKVNDDLTMVFDWSAFSRLRHMGQPLALEQAQKLASQAQLAAGHGSRYEAVEATHISALVSPANTPARRSEGKHNHLVRNLRARG